MSNKEPPMRTRLILILCPLALAACNQSEPQQAATNQPVIKVRGPEQEALHKLDAMNLAIALKRAIYDAGYTCKRVTEASFVGPYQNLDMWTAHCTYDNGEARDWAIFAGPDGSAQVRDCKDVVGSELPQCKATPQPKAPKPAG
jgi:hypothetical protein